MLVTTLEKAVLWAIWDILKNEEGRKIATTQEIAEHLPDFSVEEAELNLRINTAEGVLPLIKRRSEHKWELTQAGAMIADTLEMPTKY